MYYFLINSRNSRGAFPILTALVIISILFPSTSLRVVHADELTEPEETIEVDGAQIIDTGDAEAGLETETVVNFNETSVGSDIPPEENDNAEEPSESEGDNFSSDDSVTPSEETPQDTQSSLDDLETSNADDATASTTNDADISTNATTSAATGTNDAIGDNSLIVTGDAIAYANIVNIVNTNIFNSDGTIAFFNEVLGVDSFDLRDAFAVLDETSVSTPSCAPSACGDAYTVQTSNDATITNDVVVRADTGSNTVGSDGIISTGDAYAAANVFNLANTNIVDSNYLLIAFNNFGDYAEDIILPGADVINSLFGVSGGTLGNQNISSTNSTTIENTLTTEAQTGNNITEGGVIITGDAYTDSSIQNTLNTNIFGGSDFLLVLRVHGDWSGEIFGLPEGIAWAETENGIALYNATSGNGTGSSGNTTLTTSNSATINNNISVYALTGDNKVYGDGVVQTGDAYAAANVTNVVNTNVLGQNWALLIFDIFGNWSGNLSFGQPDLWIGGKASSPNATIMPNSEVTYTYTITNNGDATATDVRLNHFFNNAELVYTSDAHRTQQDSSGTYGAWSLGSIAPHETREVQFKTKVNNNLDRAKHEIVSRATVTAHETDADESDNSELLSIFSGKNGGGGSNNTSKPAAIKIAKSANVEVVAPSGSVDYTISVTNNGGPLYKALVRDILRNESGATTSEQYWDLGTIHADETISITYTVQFADNATHGVYTNSADVVGFTGRIRNGKPYESSEATDTIIIGDIVPEVLGAATTVCAPYLNTYLRYGTQNDEGDVRRLQTFLNDHLHKNLEVTGTFDLSTEIAVREFQSKYADEILHPWGLERDSGNVYYTTQKKINEIQCNNEIMFPLSVAQYNEIDMFKNLTLGTYGNVGITQDSVASAQLTQTTTEAAQENEYAYTNSNPGSNAIQRTQTSTVEKREASLFKTFLSPFKKLFDWSKHKYLSQGAQ